MINKRGELTTQQLVTLIILIASFVIILFLLFRLNLGETTDKEICRNSVLLQGQSGVVSGSVDCRTNYLCISGGETCDSITQRSETTVDSTNKTQIFKALADEMADCWWEFGEGKVDYSKAGVTDKFECAVCAVTGFDKNVREMDSVTYSEFYNYLKDTPYSESQSYLQYIYGRNTLEGMENLVPNGNYLNNLFDFSKNYFILTGVVKEGYFSQRGGDNLYHLIPFTSGTPSAPYPVVIAEKTQENYDEIGCDNFITKA